MSRVANFRISIRRHGIGPTLRRYCLDFLRRFVEFEVCQIESRGTKPYDWPLVEGYETRTVDSVEFHQKLCDELAGADYRWAFERGDICVASMVNGEIVGYNFSGTHPTQVRENLVFTFPDRFWYSYASFTAPSHRGKKLERDRWKVAREAQTVRKGEDAPSIWYINIANLESLAANEHSSIDKIFHGYAGYVRLGNHWRCFATRGCRKLGVGFAAVGPATS